MDEEQEPQEGETKKTIAQLAAPATASRDRAAKRKTTAKTFPLTTCAFIHDVSCLQPMRSMEAFDDAGRGGDFGVGKGG
jgi:hypothetical protein